MGKYAKAESHAAMFKKGTCRIRRQPLTGEEPTQELVVSFVPAGEKAPVEVTFGHGDAVSCLGRFTADTPLKKVLKEPLGGYVHYKGTLFKVVVLYSRGGKAKVELHETFTDNVLSGVGVIKKPFAKFVVDMKKEPRKPRECKYAVSVASYYPDNEELTTDCSLSDTPELAANWLEGDWNEQSAMHGDGKKMPKSVKAAFIAGIKSPDGLYELKSPSGWDARFVWKGARKES